MFRNKFDMILNIIKFLWVLKLVFRFILIFKPCYIDQLLLIYQQDNLEDIARLETIDNGKPIWESRMDTEGCADSVAFFGGVASTIMG